MLAATGADDEVVAAGVLHDTLEKTAADRAELSVRFGDRVAGLVSAVSEDESIASYGRRKAALRDNVAAAGPDAQTVFAADKLSKARELRWGAPLASGPLERRLDHYNRCLLLLAQRLPDSSLVKDLEEELRDAAGAGDARPGRRLTTALQRAVRECLGFCYVCVSNYLGYP